MELNVWRKLICWRRSEVNVKKNLVCKVIEKLVEHGRHCTVCPAPLQTESAMLHHFFNDFTN